VLLKRKAVIIDILRNCCIGRDEKCLKICVLDAKTLGDDVDLTVFDKFGPVQVYAETKPEEVVERIKDVDVVITNKVVLNKETLKMPQNSN